MNANFSVCLVGDCTSYNLSEIDPLKNFRDVISKADIFVFNLEGPVTSKRRWFQFKGFPPNPLAQLTVRALFGRHPCVYSAPSFAKSMNVCRFNVATLATNHVLDWGRKGIIETKKHLIENNVFPIGAGLNIADACRPLIIDINHIRIGFLNYCLIGRLGIFDLEIFSAGLNAIRFLSGYGAEGAASITKCHMEKQIASLSRTTDFIIVSLHVGRVFEEVPDEHHIDVVNRALDAGANVVVCHHSHVPQGVIARNDGKLGFLGIGDFILNWPNPFFKLGIDRPTDFSIFALMDIIEDELSLKVIPVKLSRGMPVKPSLDEAVEVLRKVRELSKPTSCLEISGDVASLTTQIK